MAKHLRYRVGIDVGLYSVGLAAIEIDDSSENPYESLPIKALNLQSVIHDAAIDPQQGQKQALSRKLVSGVKRRIRRLHERRRKRLNELDKLLEKLGYPCEQAKLMIETTSTGDPYRPWRARIELVDHFIENDAQRALAITIALRAIARHRGWRNPYASVSSLVAQSNTATSFYMDFFKKVQTWLYKNGDELYPGVRAIETSDDEIDFEGLPNWDEQGEGFDRPTVAQLVEPLLTPQPGNRFRRTLASSDSYSATMGKLHQSDICYEVLKIFEVQHVPAGEQEKLLQKVFQQVNPRDVGAAAERVGRDDLQPNRRRASKASIEFQKYRILTTIANLRIREHGAPRYLTDDERRNVYVYLTSDEVIKDADDITWDDIAEVLKVKRRNLTGVGGTTEDGLPISAKRPPTLDTEHEFRSSKAYKSKQLRALRTWWDCEADDLAKEYFIEFLGNTGLPQKMDSDEELAARENVDGVLSKLAEVDEEALDLLEKIHLASGRAAYSVDTLRRLNRRMLEEGLDLHEARKLSSTSPMTGIRSQTRWVLQRETRLSTEPSRSSLVGSELA